MPQHQSDLPSLRRGAVTLDGLLGGAPCLVDWPCAGKTQRLVSVEKRSWAGKTLTTCLFRDGG